MFALNPRSIKTDAMGLVVASKASVEEWGAEEVRLRADLKIAKRDNNKIALKNLGQELRAHRSACGKGRGIGYMLQRSRCNGRLRLVLASA